MVSKYCEKANKMCVKWLKTVLNMDADGTLSWCSENSMAG